MGRAGVQLFEELKYYVEHDNLHPRKLKAQQKQAQKGVPEAGGKYSVLTQFWWPCARLHLNCAGNAE